MLEKPQPKYTNTLFRYFMEIRPSLTGIRGKTHEILKKAHLGMAPDPVRMGTSDGVVRKYIEGLYIDHSLVVHHDPHYSKSGSLDGLKTLKFLYQSFPDHLIQMAPVLFMIPEKDYLSVGQNVEHTIKKPWILVVNQSDFDLEDVAKKMGELVLSQRVGARELLGLKNKRRERMDI